MRKIFLLIGLIAGLVLANPLQAQKAPWKELESFHEIMAKTFHPAEEGKLEPIRSRSAEMVEKAIAWQQSKAPEGYEQESVKEPLEKLVTGAREIDKLVKDKASDETLKSRLSSLHELFHQIMEKCEKDNH